MSTRYLCRIRIRLPQTCPEWKFPHAFTEACGARALVFCRHTVPGAGPCLPHAYHVARGRVLVNGHFAGVFAFHAAPTGRDAAGSNCRYRFHGPSHPTPTLYELYCYVYGYDSLWNSVYNVGFETFTRSTSHNSCVVLFRRHQRSTSDVQVDVRPYNGVFPEANAIGNMAGALAGFLTAEGPQRTATSTWGRRLVSVISVGTPVRRGRGRLL